MIKEIYQNASIKNRIKKSRTATYLYGRYDKFSFQEVIADYMENLNTLPFGTVRYESGFTYEYYAACFSTIITVPDICIYIVKYNGNVYFNYITEYLYCDQYSLYAFLRKNLE